MAKRRRKRISPYPFTPHVDPSAAWVRTPHAVVNGRHMEPGTEARISGEGGTRFIFVQHVRTDTGREWLDFWEPDGSAARYRSFKVERVRTVHRVKKARQNLAT